MEFAGTWTQRYICMYICPKIYIRLALNKSTDTQQSQTNKQFFSARLKRLVDRLTEGKEVGRLFQILHPATAKVRSPNVLSVCADVFVWIYLYCLKCLKCTNFGQLILR